MYFIYILKCEGDTLYTGITSNLERRMKEHFSKSPKCAKYTKSHPPLSLEQAWQTERKEDALSLEWHIKSLTRKNKDFIIKEPDKLKDIFKEKIDFGLYLVCSGEDFRKIKRLYTPK